MDRREFIVKSLIFSGALSVPLLAATDDNKLLRIGVVTDCHCADKKMAGTREYRDAPMKMKEAIKQFNQDKVDFVIELGDFIDSAGGSVATEISYLKTLEKEYAKSKAPRYYVYGNHCLDTLNRKEFCAHTDANENGYYSFDKGLYHIVVLDSCYTSKGVPYSRKNFHWTDANIPKKEVDWLKADLAKTTKPTIVFVHQRLDDAGHHSVKNAPEIRKVLEQSKRVIGVFQGHSHINIHVEVNGIHYTTIHAMIDGKGLKNSAYTEILLDNKGTMTIQGFVRQKSYKLT